MQLKYDYSESLQVLAEDISRRLFPYVLTSRIKCLRSEGVESSVFARCHTLSSMMCVAMDCKPLYVFEFIREKFDVLTTEKKVKIVISQLMNIPRSFNGKFNDFRISKEMVQIAYKKYLECRKNDFKIDFFKEVFS